MQPSVGLLFALCLSLCLGVSAVPHVKRDDTLLQNGRDAIALNTKFRTLNATASCGVDEVACINNTSFARCDGGRFTLTPCPTPVVCRATPNLDSPGVTIGCITEGENTMRILATGLNYTSPDPVDPSQTSHTLDSSVISLGFQNDGQGNISAPGQAASRTSTNNWINFCKTVNKPLTNGLQIRSGSCNPAPIGVIPSVNNLPSSKFIFPPNFAAVAKNQPFTVQVAVNNLETGWFTNPANTYLSAPQEVNMDGNILGHSHIVIERLSGFGQTTPPNPRNFDFFKGLNDRTVGGVMQGDVTPGLSAGYYRITLIHTAMNHQPVVLPIAQHGAMGDMVYFSVV